MPLQTPDKHTTPEAKNDALSHLLRLDWNPQDIQTIKRSDTAEFKGWTAFLVGEETGSD